MSSNRARGKNLGYRDVQDGRTGDEKGGEMRKGAKDETSE